MHAACLAYGDIGRWAVMRKQQQMRGRGRGEACLLIWAVPVAGRCQAARGARLGRCNGSSSESCAVCPHAQGLQRMRAVGALAAGALQHAGSLVAPGVTTDAIDASTHNWIIAQGAYPSMLGYGGEWVCDLM